MIKYLINITDNQIKKINALLSGTLKNLRGKVYYNAVSRALLAANTEVNKGIREIYNISAQTIKASSKMKKELIKHTDDTIGNLNYAGNMIELKKFKINTNKYGKDIKASVLKKNSGTHLERAFVAQMKYGKNIFERAAKSRHIVQVLYGPSVAHMAGKEDIVNKAEEKAKKVLDERIEHEIDRILNGYGMK